MRDTRPGFGKEKQMKYRRPLLSLLAPLGLTLLLSACTVTFLPEEQPAPEASRPTSTPTRVNPRPAPAPRPAVPNFRLNTNLEYRCSNASMAVRYTSNDAVRILYGDWINLTRSTSRDGWFVYRNADYTWYAKGHDAYLEHNGKTVRSDCVLQDS